MGCRSKVHNNGFIVQVPLAIPLVLMTVRSRVLTSTLDSCYSILTSGARRANCVTFLSSYMPDWSHSRNTAYITRLLRLEPRDVSTILKCSDWHLPAWNTSPSYFLSRLRRVYCQTLPCIISFGCVLVAFYCMCVPVDRVQCLHISCFPSRF